MNFKNPLLNDLFSMTARGHEAIQFLVEQLCKTETNEDAHFSYGDPEVSWKILDILRIFDSQQNFDLVPDVAEYEISTEEVSLELIKNGNFKRANSSHDLIICDFINYTDESAVENLENCFDSLANNGVCLAFLKSYEQLKRLEADGFWEAKSIYPSCVINIPNDCFEHTGYFSPRILTLFVKSDKFRLLCFGNLQISDFYFNCKELVSRHRGYYLGEPDFEKFQSISKRNLADLIQLQHERNFTGESLSTGILDTLPNFPGFEIWEMIETSSKPIQDYESYEKFILRDLIKSSTTTAENDIENIYFPKAIFGSNPNHIIDEIQIDLPQDDAKYFKFEIDSKKIQIKYLLAYLKSPWGKKFIDKLLNDKNTLIGSPVELSQNDFFNLMIARPNSSLQKEIVNNLERMNDVVEVVNEMKSALVLNPASSSETTENIDKILNSIKEVSPLLRDESISHEFKASLRTPYPEYPEREISQNGNEVYRLGKLEFPSKKQINIFLENIVLKTIASLLNTRGGQLVIGVHEFGNEKNVVGIDREGFKSHDEYERHIVQIMKNEFGAAIVSEYITTKIVPLQNEYVCVVDCAQFDGEEAVWFKDGLFVRTGPRIDELKGKEQAKFILQRSRRN